MRKLLVPFSLVLLIVLAGCAATAVPTAPTPTLVLSTAMPTMLPDSSTPTATPVALDNPTATPSQAKTEATSTPMSPSPTATSLPPTATPASQPTWSPDGAIGDSEYAHQVEAAGVVFYWSSDAQYLYGALEAKTKGWVSVGFDPANKMQGANYVFGFVQDGKLSIKDMFGVRPFGANSHPADDTLGGKDDILESGGREENGVTVIEFKIPLDSGDANDKPLVSGATYKIILAMGGKDSFDSMHSAAGSTQISID